MRNILKTAFVFFSCAVIFFSVAYAVLYADYKGKEKKAQAENESVVYEPKSPDNKTVLFIFPDKLSILSYLDFSSQSILTAAVTDYDEDTGYRGYKADYYLELNTEAVSGIIDRLGGITVSENGQAYRYTGEQVLDLFAYSTDNTVMLKTVFDAVLKQISQNGISNDDILFLINNSKTNLTVPDCFRWYEYIKEMCLRHSSID